MGISPIKFLLVRIRKRERQEGRDTERQEGGERGREEERREGRGIIEGGWKEDKEGQEG
jgi:hypothetical protein